MHPSIEFTSEIEKNDSISFLDVFCVRRADGSIQTSVYRKPTWTGLYISFYSFVPRSYKVGLIRTLVTRAVRICSPDTLFNELHIIRRTLLMNGYPVFFINKYLVPPTCKYPILGPERKPIYVRVPFTGDSNLSFVRRALKSALSIYPAAKLVILCSTKCIPVSDLKDKRPISAQTNVIYSFVCNCGSRYIGRTARSLEVRVKEHIPKWLLDGHSRPPRSGLLPHSAVARHLISNDCDRVNVRQRFSVLFSSQSSFILKLLESLAIKRFSPDLCVQKDFVIDWMLPW